MGNEEINNLTLQFIDTASDSGLSDEDILTASVSMVAMVYKSLIDNGAVASTIRHRILHSLDLRFNFYDDKEPFMRDRNNNGNDNA